MANPEHIAQLDGFDRFTVKLYRIGLSICALALMGSGALRLFEGTFSSLFFNDAPPWYTPFDPIIALGVFIAVSNIHIYDKRFRWFFSAITWAGAAALIATNFYPPIASLIGHLGLGLIFITISAIALKERLCFKIVGLRAVPLMLAAAIFLMFGDKQPLAGGTLLLSGAVLAFLAVQKIRMPHHFDIGDKKAYQN